MITDRWIYRVFYGAIVAALVFGMVWETVTTGKLPAVPFSTVLLMVALTGGDAAITFLKRP
jgi:hypothetical protein